MVSHHPLPNRDFALPLSPTSVAGSAPPAAGRASSVISGRSATRRHRHTRSHQGGTSASANQNEFPVFAHTGDVEIIVQNASGRRENRYVLHRLILSQSSGFFAAGMRTEWSARAIEGVGGPSSVALSRINENDSVAAGSSSRASSQERRSSSFEQNRKRWRYELDWSSAREDELPMLVQRDNTSNSIFGNGNASARPPPVRSKPPASSENFFRSMANFASLNINDRTQQSVPAEPGDEVLKDYDNLFRIMYNYSPALDSINIATAYSECKALLHLADMYDALEIVGSRVDHHLLRFGARLFKQIAKYPPSYLKLGYLARSPTIFIEALIHVVGQWPLAAPQLRGQVETNVIELIEDKVDEMREQEERAEAKLWRLTLTTSRGERVTPANDFLSWLALSLFRQWFAENTTPAPGAAAALRDQQQQQPTHHSRPGSRSGNHAASQRVPAAPPSGPPPSGRVYRMLGAPSSASDATTASSGTTSYLSREEQKRFLKAPGAQLGAGLDGLYTRDNLRRFERRVDEVKAQAREVVRPLMRNYLELDLRDFGPAGLGYLTCTRVEPRELPWDEA